MYVCRNLRAIHATCIYMELSIGIHVYGTYKKYVCVCILAVVAGFIAIIEHSSIDSASDTINNNNYTSQT